MLLSTPSLGRTFARLAGRTTRIGDLLRFNSSSPLSRHDLLYPSPENSPWISSPRSTLSTPPLLLPSKTTSTPSSSSSLPSTQRSHPQIPQPKPSLKNAPPPRKPQPPPKRTAARTRVTTSSLLSLLRDRDGNPSSPPTPPPDITSLVPDKGSLEVTGTREEVEGLARRLMEAANSLEEGVDVASWILRVTEEGRRDEGVQTLVYAVINAFLFHLGSFQPRPHPDPVLQFLLANQSRARLSFNRNQNPLIKLLEVYARLYTQDRRRIDPSAAAPPPRVVAELEALRLQHLDAVRAIHQAMKQVDKDVFTVRSYTSLMEAYDKGKSFKDVEEVWKLMRAEGGVGINQRALSVYFDACGFGGSLPRALATWKDVQTSGFALDENNYHAYQECLTRCGAWDELLVFLSDQQARHLVDPTAIPSLSAAGLAAMLKLANQIVINPRHRSLREVDREEYKRLKTKIKALALMETWEEVERILNSKGRIFIPTRPKTGNGRRPDRERPQ